MGNLAISANEKEQTGWFDLPYEMRIMIIEQMDTKTRGNLSSCSKLCCKEVRRSKNFITGIKLVDFDSPVCLLVQYIDCHFPIIEFSKITANDKEQCLISYKKSYGVRNPNLDKTVDRSVNDIALENFYRFLNDAIHLKEILINLDGFPFDKTSIIHLKKLERISMLSNGPIDLVKCGFLSINQLVSATYCVEIESTTIEIEQLINFKAKYIKLRKVTFSPEQLKQYLKAWNNNKIDENIIKLEIECSDGVDFYDLADDIVSDLEVIWRKTRMDEKFFNIKNNCGKLASITITDDVIEVLFNMTYGECDFNFDEENDPNTYDYYN